jgi:TonB family protein
MGYQALLFCPNEKTARTVTQVLSELDFEVASCTEPFSAVKKMMGERFDAIVVDCDNEQNATLLFKSARNAPNNQSALAVAVVEGQAGVAKAFRIGANLVLTKPINVEQSKGTLRVARGLLRRSETAKAGAVTAKSRTPAPPAKSLAMNQSAAPRGAVAPNSPISSPIIPAQKQTPQTSFAASACSGIAEMAKSPEPSNLDRERDSSPWLTTQPTPAPVVSAPSPETALNQPAGPSSTGFSAAASSSSASAPARARDAKPSVSAADKTSAGISGPENSNDRVVSGGKNSPTNQAAVSAPPVTFDGAVESGTKTETSANKKILMAVAATVLVAATGYNVWTHLGRPNGEAASTPASVLPTTISAVPSETVAAPSSAEVSTTSTSPVNPRPKVAQPSGNAKTAIPQGDNSQLHPNKAKREADSPQPAAHPIVLNGGHAQNERSAGSNDAVAPTIATLAEPESGGTLPNLMNGASPAPAPVLQTMSVSQGISQGLIIKKIAPSYPPTALHLRVEGSVQLLATVTKKGDISAVKVMSGDPSLARAAVDAVKQWKYKPYLLDGSPVEIQTQVTVNFKLPH